MKDQADKQESQQNLTVLQKRLDRAQKQGKTAEEIQKIKTEYEIHEKIRIASKEGKLEQVDSTYAELEKQKPKRKPDMARFERLAKPKDKWKLGKQLLKLYKDFPHDRVLERMIKEEFASNQAFRYPAEYDTFRKNADLKLKILETEPGKGGLKKMTGEFGSAKLEEFK